MNRIQSSTIAFIALMTAIGLSGCGSSRPIGTISGRVTYNGQPVEEGLVSFYDPDTGAGSQAELQSGGVFRIRNAEGGLPPGEYRVTIMPPTVKQPDTEVTEGGYVVKEVPNITDKYRDVQASGFTDDVSTGDNEFEFAMEGNH